MIIIYLILIINYIWCTTKEELNRKLSNDYTVDPNGRFNNAELLTVHIISHTHDDIGWVRTIDEYYVKQVRYILTTTIQALVDHPERKFTYVEQKFFQMWWNEQNDATKETVRKLVKNGQFELNLGGWCMPDEAAPEYETMIYNMAVGVQFIKEQFNIRPKVAWHIDPFGHGKQNARLLADMGFDAFAVNRIDYRKKDDFKKTQEMEFIWRTSNSLGNDTSIFVHVLSNHYGPPSEFDVIWPDYTLNSKWPNIHNNSEMESYPNNLEDYCNNVVNMLRTREKYYNNGGHLLITMGDDFTHTNAEQVFQQVDGVMKYINDHFDKYNIKMQYSHFSDYINAVHKTNKKWTVYTDDLMPYASAADSFWTGYYTSRPRFKGESRDASNYLRSVDILDTNYIINHNKVEQSNYETKLKLRKAASQVLHHDAITGTEKQYVADDYLKILHDDLYFNKRLMENIIIELTNNNYKFDLNITNIINNIKPNNNATLVIYNNLGWERDEVICIISKISTINITTVNDDKIDYQIVPIPSYSLDINNGSYYIYFNVKVPSLGHNTFIISYSDSATITPKSSDNTFIENSLFKITIDKNSGKLLTYVDKKTLLETQLNNQLLHYPGKSNSGAYVFRPDGDATIVTTSAIIVEVYKGSIVEEAHIHYKTGYVLILKSYYFGDNQQLFEMSYHLGPLDAARELISRFNSNINNNGISYGDGNGLEYIKRYNKDTVSPIAGNYYPMTTRVYIEDTNNNNKLILLTDRAHGFASLHNGELEVMLHRRCTHDDGFGVDEALTENDRVIIKIFGLIGNNNIDIMRKSSLLLNHNTHLFYTLNNNKKYNGIISSSMLKQSLPNNIHLTTLYVPSYTPIIHLRLHHIYESSDNTLLSKPVTINLDQLFSNIHIIDVKELILSGNELLSDVQNERLQWLGNDGSSTTKKKNTLVGTTVTLNPMDIGTYEIRYSK